MDASSYTSEIDITRVMLTETAVLGRRRTVQSLSHFEKIFIAITLLTLTASLAFTLYRLLTLPTNTADYTLAFLLLLNIVFCYFYTMHGVLYEQPYEIFVLVVTTVVLLVYLVISYSESDRADSLKVGRLVFMSIASPLVSLCAIKLLVEYYESGNLVFRTVGADPSMQSMCRKLQRAIVLILFDAQALGSSFTLLLFGAELSTTKIVLLSCGSAFIVVWSVIGFVGMHREKPVLIWIFLAVSPLPPAYVLWQIVTTNMFQSDQLIEVLVYMAGVLLLLVHIYLCVNTVQVYRNFGKGLREKVSEVKCSTPRQRLSYGSTDSSGSLMAP